MFVSLGRKNIADGGIALGKQLGSQRLCFRIVTFGECPDAGFDLRRGFEDLFELVGLRIEAGEHVQLIAQRIGLRGETQLCVF